MCMCSVRAIANMYVLIIIITIIIILFCLTQQGT